MFEATNPIWGPTVLVLTRNDAQGWVWPRFHRMDRRSADRSQWSYGFQRLGRSGRPTHGQCCDLFTCLKYWLVDLVAIGTSRDVGLGTSTRIANFKKKTQPVSKYLEHILFPFPWLWNEPQITLRWGTSAWRARAKDPPPWLPAMRRNGGRSSQWLNWGLYSYGPTNSYIQMGLFHDI